MNNKQVVNLTEKRLELNPVVYSVEFTHDQRGMSFTVCDVQESARDMLAVADDLEYAANALRKNALSFYDNPKL